MQVSIVGHVMYFLLPISYKMKIKRFPISEFSFMLLHTPTSDPALIQSWTTALIRFYISVSIRHLHQSLPQFFYGAFHVLISKSVNQRIEQGS